MRRVLIGLAIAIATFSLGVSVTVVYWWHNLPEVIKLERPTVPNSFPGRSIIIYKPIHPSAYFAGVSLSDNEAGNKFKGDWYSKYLRAMNEIALPSLVDEWESYRFLWLRSFHQPIAIHVWRTGSKYFIVAKGLNGTGGYEPGVLNFTIAHQLSAEEWTTFLIYLEDARYWQMPTYDPRVATDGAQWILEGYSDHYYHVVDRYSPDSGAYYDLCLYLLKTAGLLKKIPLDEIY